MNTCPPQPLSRSRRTACGVVLVLAWLWSANSWADAIFLRGGEKLLGRVLREEPAMILFESQSLGQVPVPRERIERLERDTPAASPAITNRPVATALRPVGTNQFYPWTSDEPGGDSFDWIQLKTGEWLKGRVKSLLEEKLEFDSEKLDLHTFDWDDIRTVRSPRLQSVRFEKGKPLDGSLLVTATDVHLATRTATNTFPRAGLIAITPTGNREVDKWSGSISAGVSFRSGNTRETDANTHVTLQRRTPTTRLGLDYLGNYSKVNGVQAEQNHRFTGQHDYFLSRRLYTRVPDVEYYRDPLQNLDHRLTLGGGIGYDLIKTPRTEWNVTLGPAWQRNVFHSVPTGEAASADSVALVFSTRFDTELTRRLDFILEYRAQLSRKETGNNTHHAAATLEFEVHKRLTLDLSFVWDRITNPKTESNGAAPTPDDFRLITSLGIDF